MWTNSISSYTYQGLPRCSFPSGLSNTILHKFLFCPIHVTWSFPSHAPLHDYWTNIWWQNISWSFSLCSLLLFLQMALQPLLGLGLLYNMPPGLSNPCSVSPFVYTHISHFHGHVIQPSRFWSSSSSCYIQLSIHLFSGIAVSCILSIWPSHRILWRLIDLTMFVVYCSLHLQPASASPPHYKVPSTRTNLHHVFSLM